VFVSRTGTKSLWCKHSEMTKQISSMPVCSLYATRTSECDQKDCLLFYIMLQRHVLFILLIICYLHFLSLNTHVFYCYLCIRSFCINTILIPPVDSFSSLEIPGMSGESFYLLISPMLDAFYFVSLFAPFGNTLFFGYNCS